MKLNAYEIGRHLNTGAAIFVVALLAVTVTLAITLTNYFSKEGVLYRNNVQAAEDFVRTVKADYPGNRASVYGALHHMRSTYIETGENDFAKLVELERLQDWLLKSQTAGEEMLFLSEVRTHGEVVAHQVWFCGFGQILAAVTMTIIATVFLHIKFLDWLCEIEPRLRPIGT